jgi:fermentation-respiration switch protein FrsA (DUF1100 family)
VIRFLALLVGLYLAAVAAAYLFQRRLQYFPDPSDPLAPAGAEDVRLLAGDGTPLRAWFWPGTRGPTVLVLHGNAGSRADRRHLAEGLVARGHGAFLLDYRGYGGSGGAPTEAGLLLDAEAAVHWLRARGATRLVYYGESLGCGVAAGLILQSGADSLVPVARRAYPWLPIGLLLRDRFDATARMRGVACPVLAIHGARDPLIEPARGRALLDAAKGPKEWWLVPDAGHNDVIDVAGDAFFARVDLFLASLAR